MFNLLLLAALFASCMAHATVDNYFYSAAVGTGSGSSFSSEGENGAGGRIAGIRVYEYPSNYICGIQLKYKHEEDWSAIMGREYGTAQEIILYEDEFIVQVSGKYSSYIYQVIFGTSRGRTLFAGQPSQTSFNMYPQHEKAELILLSGNFNGHGITSLAAHWAVFSEEEQEEAAEEDSSS